MMVAARLFLVLVAILFVTSDSHAAQRVALVIGNGAYKNQPSLPNPPRDASDMSESLKRLGFTVTTLLDADAAATRKALVEFGRATVGSEMAIVFYAGHGIEIGGQNWLIPVDAELRNDTDAEYEAVSLKAVTQQVASARQLGLVILDACRNNPFAAKMQRSIRTRAVTRGLAPTEPTDNVLVAYAAKDGTTANDGDGRNSPFTAALLRNMETPGLEITFMFRNVRDEVMAATKREQQPFVYGSLSREQIFLKPGAGGAVSPSATSPGQGAAQAWEAVKDSNSIPALESFVRYFGDTFYGDLARGRITDLKKQGANTVTALPSQTRTLAAASGTEPTVKFGGSPYCEYRVTLRNPRISAPADAQGNIANATLSATMFEESVPPCPHAPIGAKPHSYTGGGSVDPAGNIVLNFAPAAGNSPKANATFTGKVVDGRLVGTLSVQRSDQSGNLAWKVVSQFK
ncbi:MAG: hypothetical protein A4S14_13110 [Proteobacteria bacterium SG_bin9]|nr:MAG: hypothetical protein A4S14_13110 [Proteobacteria bacterium SG_bin9]